MHQMRDPAQGQSDSRFGLTVMLAAMFMLIYQTMFMPPLEAEEGVEATALENQDEQAAQKKTNQQNGILDSRVEIQPLESNSTAPAPEQLEKIHIPVSGQHADAAVRGGFDIVFSNQGGFVQDFILDGYDAPEGSRISADGKITLGQLTDKGVGLLSIQTRGESDFTLKPTDTFELKQNKVLEDGRHEIRFERTTAQNVKVERIYRLKPGHFLFEHELKLTNMSERSIQSALDMHLLGAAIEKAGGMFASSSAQFQTICKGAEDREHWTASDLDDGPVELTGDIAYGAISWHYFIASLIPEKPSDIERCSVPAIVPAEDAPEQEVPLHNILSYKAASMSPGTSQTYTTRAFFGPKQLKLLEDVDVALEENLEFGMFEFISKPILWVLVWLYGLLGNFGWAIIVLTLLIKLVTFPLTQKSYVSMQQMKIVGPELKELQKKYAHDRAMLGQKQMELYKDRGINPLAGCLPMLLQMPIWFALFRTLWNSVELYQQPFVSWIIDLSQPDSLPGLGIALLPFIVGGLMFVQTAFQPTPQDQPQMKYIMMGMPVFMVFLYFTMPSGLAIYSITNSALTMVQQYFIKKQYGDGPEGESQGASS